MNNPVMLVIKQVVVLLSYWSLIGIDLAVLKHIDTKIGYVGIPLSKHWYDTEQ